MVFAPLWTLDGHFDRARGSGAWFGSTVVWRHRAIDDYVRLVSHHGLRLDTLSEWEPGAGLLVGDPDDLARRRRVPLMLSGGPVPTRAGKGSKLLRGRPQVQALDPRGSELYVGAWVLTLTGVRLSSWLRGR
jgi:hypothetical protein